MYGKIIRPLERTFKEKEIPTSKPDFTEQFNIEGEIIQVKGWRDLILPLVVPDPDNNTFDIYLFEHPQYDNPLVLAQTIGLSPESCYYFYQDRWAVEQLPLATKQMIGAGRQFVFALESCFRWSELALIVGSILIYLAAVLPAVPTGFWDRQPKNTPGRLRRVIARCDFPKAHQFSVQIRKKASVTDHLPKGIMAHRRVKAET